ncbi:MAG: DMT family transporter [Bacteroidota bacterium]|nr:DMT family transporter [Bacteroidota bacterium]
MPFLGELSALLTAVCWSGSSLSFAEAAKRIGSVQLNISRLMLATIFLLVTIGVGRISTSLSASQVLFLVISGMIGFVFGDTFLFKAYEEIGPRLTMLMMSGAPAVSAVLAFFFLGEVLPVWGVAGIGVTIAGIALVVLERPEAPTSSYIISKPGLVYGALAALGQGVGLIFAKLAFDEGTINGFVATFVRVASATIVYVPLGFLTRRYKNPVEIFSRQRKAFGFTLLGAILGPYLGVTFSLIAVANTKVGIAAALMATVPILMLPLVRYIYKESFSWKAIAGAFVAVAGVAILFLR